MRPRHRYTAEQLAWLRRGYRRWQIAELTERFNARFCLDMRPSLIKAALNRHGIRSGRPAGLIPGTLRTYTAQEIAWLRRHRPQMQIAELTRAFNARFCRRVTEAALFNRCKMSGIQAGSDGRFRPGQAPPNKGRKVDLVPAMRDRQFQPGHTPHTWQPIGAYAQDGHGRWKIKVSDQPGPSRRNWRTLSHLIWAEHHGPVPPKHVVVVLDGDEDHLTIDNLLAVRRAVLIRANHSGYAQLPPDPALRRAALLEASVRQAAHDLGRRAGLRRRQVRDLIQGPSFVRQSGNS